MSKQKVPSKLFNEFVGKYPAVFEAHEKLGSEIRAAGPLEDKTLQLIQLAAAAATGSEGGVHSHTRRALGAGAAAEEIYHALIALISTIGFPRVMAAISWSRDIIEK